MIHAFTLKGDVECGLLFPSSKRRSSDKDLPADDKVTTMHRLVDCPACRAKLGLPPPESEYQCGELAKTLDAVLDGMGKMSRNPDAQVTPAHGLAVIVWCALDVDTWPEFGARLAQALQAAMGRACAPRELRRLIRSFWPS